MKKFICDYKNLIKEWHAEKNNSLDPKRITPRDGKKVWWRCARGHEWMARISSRTIYGTGCPKCSPQTSKQEIRLYSELKLFFKKYKLES